MILYYTDEGDMEIENPDIPKIPPTHKNLSLIFQIPQNCQNSFLQINKMLQFENDSIETVDSARINDLIQRMEKLPNWQVSVDPTLAKNDPGYILKCSQFLDELTEINTIIKSIVI